MEEEKLMEVIKVFGRALMINSNANEYHPHGDLRAQEDIDLTDKCINLYKKLFYVGVEHD